MDIFFYSNQGGKCCLLYLKRIEEQIVLNDMRIVRTMTSRGREVGKETERGRE